MKFEHVDVLSKKLRAERDACEIERATLLKELEVTRARDNECHIGFKKCQEMRAEAEKAVFDAETKTQRAREALVQAEQKVAIASSTVAHKDHQLMQFSEWVNMWHQWTRQDEQQHERALREAQDSASKLKLQIEQLRGDVGKYEATNMELEKARHENTALHTAMQNTRTNAIAALSERDNLRKDLEDTRTMLAQHQKEACGLRDSARNAKSSASVAITQLEKLQADLQEAKSHRNAFEQEAKSLHESVALLQKRLEEEKRKQVTCKAVADLRPMGADVTVANHDNIAPVIKHSAQAYNDDHASSGGTGSRCTKSIISKEGRDEEMVEATSGKPEKNIMHSERRIEFHELEHMHKIEAQQANVSTCQQGCLRQNEGMTRSSMLDPRDDERQQGLTGSNMLDLRDDERQQGQQQQQHQQQLQRVERNDQEPLQQQLQCAERSDQQPLQQLATQQPPNTNTMLSRAKRQVLVRRLTSGGFAERQVMARHGARKEEMQMLGCNDCGKPGPLFYDKTDRQKYCKECWVAFYGQLGPASASAASVDSGCIVRNVATLHAARATTAVQRREVAISASSRLLTGLLPEDAPGGHCAHVECRIKDSGGPTPQVSFHFQRGGVKIPFQTTVFAAGSRHAAEVIARACYMKFQQGWSKPDILAFRNKCYARIRSASVGQVNAEQRPLLAETQRVRKREENTGSIERVSKAART